MFGYGWWSACDDNDNTATAYSGTATHTHELYAMEMADWNI